MAKKAKASKKSNVLNVNFEGVESSGKHPEGRFVFAVDEVEVRNSTNSGNDYLSFKLKSTEGVVFYNASLASHALWNFKNFLEAAGQDVPDGEMEIDLDELKELEVGAEIIHEKYEGKTRSVVAEIVPVDDVDGESSTEEEEEEEAPTYESVQEMDLDDLLELAKENDIKVNKKQQKKIDELRDFICEQLELEEDDDSEDGEEEDHTYESIQEMDSDDLDEVCEENDIKVTAKVKKKLALYRNAVCEALELEEEEEEEEEAPTKGKKGSKSKK